MIMLSVGNERHHIIRRRQGSMKRFAEEHECLGRTLFIKTVVNADDGAAVSGNVSLKFEINFSMVRQRYCRASKGRAGRMLRRNRPSFEGGIGFQHHVPMFFFARCLRIRLVVQNSKTLHWLCYVVHFFTPPGFAKTVPTHRNLP